MFLNPAFAFLSFSLLLHLSLGGGLSFFKNSSPQLLQRPIEIEIIDQDLDKASQLDDKNRLQIVDQDQQLNDEVPEETKLLSAFNQKVVTETRAEKNGDFQNKVASGQAQPQQKQKRPEKKTPTKKELRKGPSLADLSPQFSPTPQGANLPVPAGESSQSDDYLKDKKTGLQTLLSTREFVYFSYYNRIKRKLRQTWEPTVRKKVKMIYKTGRSLASARDLITQVQITLNSNGELVQLDILNQSGVNVLDQAAIDAFKAASPFPNPPSGLVEGDGLVRIRWDFVLEASAFEIKTQKYARVKN